MPNLKPLSRAQSALAIFGGVVCANATLWAVLSLNLINEIYPVDADSIGIPIGFALIDSMFILLLGLSGTLLPQQQIGWRVANCVLQVLASLLGTVLALQWLYPNHYLAGAAFFLVPMMCMLSLLRPSNKTNS